MEKLIVKAFFIIGLVSSIAAIYFVSKLLFWVLLWILLGCIILIVGLVILAALFTPKLDDTFDQGEHY